MSSEEEGKRAKKANGWTPADGDHKIAYESTRTYYLKQRRKRMLKDFIKYTALILLITAAVLVYFYFIK